MVGWIKVIFEMGGTSVRATLLERGLDSL